MKLMKFKQDLQLYSMHTITRKDVKAIFPPKPKWSHKGQAGKLLIIGGSLRYSGSPAFVALAAIRTGADLTLVAAPRRAADIISSLQPDLITEPMHCDHLCPSDVKHLLQLIAWADAIVIGGGLDRKPETYQAVRTLMKKTRKPCVIDAEALRAVSEHQELIHKNCVLTPHENEFQVLGGGKPSHNINQRMHQVNELAQKLKSTILLKGHVDIISDGSQIAMNKTGNPYMTKGGTGDTLAGICGALLARNISPFQSAAAAAWINGAAGDLTLKQKGPGLLVSEILDNIPKVIW
jgi:NAD(P)H-hydrate epimerase